MKNTLWVYKNDYKKRKEEKREVNFKIFRW